MRWSFYISFVMLAIGGFYGTLQALDKMGVDLYRYLPDPLYRYYLGLTVHGVTLGWMFTVFFIIAFLNLVTIHGLRRPLASPGLAKATFGLAVLGAAVALIPTFTNEASVLWTFYAPLQAHPAFYIGLTAIVVATWTAGLNAYLTWRSWKREHPEERTPLMSFAALTTWAMWALASVGVAASMLFQLIPWSSGLLAQVNPLLNRSLFWFTGHPVVYFWLLPAYISWYTMLPAQVGGRLFSESLARLVFLAFIPFSIPTGLHHMFPDPGIPHSTKLLHAILTFAVVFPSLVTAFTVVASVEEGARRNGGNGPLPLDLEAPDGLPTRRLGAAARDGPLCHGRHHGHHQRVVRDEPRRAQHDVDPRPPSHPGGGSGDPHLDGRKLLADPAAHREKLWSVRLSTLQVWTWFFGMAIMARGMHWMGMAASRAGCTSPTRPTRCLTNGAWRGGSWAPAACCSFFPARSFCTS